VSDQIMMFGVDPPRPDTRERTELITGIRDILEVRVIQMIMED
jgi:hypothetical protein